MSIQRLAQDALEEIKKSVSANLTEPETDAIAKILEEKMIEAVKHSSKSCATAAATACGAESDLAHKIAKEVQLTQNALIANLKSMR